MSFTLYQRIGGLAGVTALIDDFYDRVLADPELAPFFEQISMDRLRLMQREFFCAALDGPVEYTGMPASRAHQGRGIDRRHFSRFAGHLLDTLQQRFDIADEDEQLIMERIATYFAGSWASVPHADHR